MPHQSQGRRKIQGKKSQIERLSTERGSSIILTPKVSLSPQSSISVLFLFGHEIGGQEKKYRCAPTEKQKGSERLTILTPNH